MDSLTTSEKSSSRLIIICDNLKSNPHCPHGPTLLYKRVSAGKETQHYYACSAYQNRKDCQFMFSSKTVDERKKKILFLEKKKILSKIDAIELRKRLETIKNLLPSNRFFCVTCSSLLLPGEVQSLHDGHSLKLNITDYSLKHPSQLLSLKSHSKKEAQFMFSDSTVDVILEALKLLNIKKLICLGTPTIHERVQENNDNFESILLDIDHRYYQFYRDEQFCWFNMMNCFPMLGKSTFDRVRDFLHSDNVALLMDPPFSARSEPLSYTLSELNSIYQQQMRDLPLPVLWIFPYFKESDVLSAWPDMTMLDFDVKYTNHKKFQKSDKTSVIRIFTNLNASKFELPECEGYRYCKKCKRWVSKNNKHCYKCQICPSKNGQSYKHCDVCNRCIKYSWEHCLECNRCALPKHPCKMWQVKNVQIKNSVQNNPKVQGDSRKRKPSIITSNKKKKHKKSIK